jgi:hypothetical protein
MEVSRHTPATSPLVNPVVHYITDGPFLNSVFDLQDTGEVKQNYYGHMK